MVMRRYQVLKVLVDKPNRYTDEHRAGAFTTRDGELHLWSSQYGSHDGTGDVAVYAPGTWERAVRDEEWEERDEDWNPQAVASPAAA